MIYLNADSNQILSLANIHKHCPTYGFSMLTVGHHCRRQQECHFLFQHQFGFQLTQLILDVIVLLKPGNHI